MNEGCVFVESYRKQAHPQNSDQAQGWEKTLIIENHPADSRVKICEDNIFQSLTSRMGTGGGNVPMLLEERSVDSARTQDKILCLLFETYGTKEVIEWGTNVLAALQQTEVLRQGMYESGIQSKTKDGNELDDNTLPCPKLIAEWLLRNMREQEECGCSSQRRESAQQCTREFAESMQELPLENTSSCKDLLDMWSKGQGLWILRQTLSEIQKVWESIDCEWKGGDGMNSVSETVVRRLTPL